MERNTYLSIAAGAGVATVFALLGFFSFRDGGRFMGWVIFIAGPAVVGFSVGFIARSGKRATATLGLTLIATSVVLLATKAEGTLCIAMAMPLILAGVGTGAWVGDFVRKRWIDKGQGGAFLKWLLLAALPLGLMGAYKVETPFRRETRVESVDTQMFYRASPQRVWDRLKAVERIDAAKPLLMRIGLPQPIRCELQRGAIGGKRICIFNNGVIEEEITQWIPPERMGMRITRVTLPGRHWLGFQEAVYQLKPSGEGTIVHRTTTITSHLYPAWYWRGLERWGVRTEHRYLFEGVRKTLGS